MLLDCCYSYLKFNYVLVILFRIVFKSVSMINRFISIANVSFPAAIIFAFMKLNFSSARNLFFLFTLTMKLYNDNDK